VADVEELEKIAKCSRTMPELFKRLDEAIRDQIEGAEKYKKIVEEMAPSGPLEAPTWAREKLWEIAEDEKKHKEALLKVRSALCQGIMEEEKR